jgi:hypothetical protein
VCARRLKELSAALTAEDGEGSPFCSIAFEGTNPYPVFTPNAFKANKGCDGMPVTSYYRYAVKDEVTMPRGGTTSRHDCLLLRARLLSSVGPCGARVKRPPGPLEISERGEGHQRLVFPKSPYKGF